MAGWFLLPWIKHMVGWFFFAMDKVYGWLVFFAMDLSPWLDGFCCHG